MSTHEDIARANATCTATREWKITMRFYAAVHAVNHSKYGPSQAQDDFRHPDRKAFLAKSPTLKAVEVEYKTLESLSRVARYWPSLHPMSQTEEDDAERYATADR